MPYGNTHSTGHGCRPTRYRWSREYDPWPRFVPDHRRGKRGRARARAVSRLSSRNGRASRFQDKEPLAWGEWREAEIRRLTTLGFAEAMVVSAWQYLLPLGLLALFAYGAAKISKRVVISISKYSDAIRKETHKHRKTSVNNPPTAEMLREAWEASRNGSVEARLLVGSLLSDLEPVVDQSFLRDENGTIVGRRPGIKGWLRQHCNDLLPHYKALMAYKALADKLRVALGIEEPDSLEAVLTRTGAQRTEEEMVNGTMGNEPKSMDVKCYIILCKSDKRKVIMRWDEMKMSGAMESMASLGRWAGDRLGLFRMRRGSRKGVPKTA